MFVSCVSLCDVLHTQVIIHTTTHYRISPVGINTSAQNVQVIIRSITQKNNKYCNIPCKNKLVNSKSSKNYDLNDREGNGLRCFQLKNIISYCMSGTVINNCVNNKLVPTYTDRQLLSSNS